MMEHHCRGPPPSPCPPSSRRRLSRLAARARTPSSCTPAAPALGPAPGGAAAATPSRAGGRAAVSVQPPKGPGRMAPARLRAKNSAFVSTCAEQRHALGSAWVSVPLPRLVRRGLPHVGLLTCGPEKGTSDSTSLNGRAQDPRHATRLHALPLQTKPSQHTSPAGATPGACGAARLGEGQGQARAQQGGVRGSAAAARGELHHCLRAPHCGPVTNLGGGREGCRQAAQSCILYSIQVKTCVVAGSGECCTRPQSLP